MSIKCSSWNYKRKGGHKISARSRSCQDAEATRVILSFPSSVITLFATRNQPSCTTRLICSIQAIHTMSAALPHASRFVEWSTIRYDVLDTRETPQNTVPATTSSCHDQSGSTAATSLTAPTDTMYSSWEYPPMKTKAHLPLLGGVTEVPTPLLHMFRKTFRSNNVENVVKIIRFERGTLS